MTPRNAANLPASVHARLQNHARATHRPFQEQPTLINAGTSHSSSSSVRT